MNKELEVFGYLYTLAECENILNNLPKTKTKNININKMLEDLKGIKQALTPPTSEELCKELSEWFNLGKDENVFYRQNTKEFIIDTALVCFEEECVWLNKDGRIEMIQDLPPHLITMIGRFYESVKQ